MALFLASVTVAHAQATAPTVSTVAVTSDPGTDDTYALGDTIEVGLTFDEAVTVTGDPYLLIDVGGTNRRASYHSGSTTTQLLFQYTVLAGDDDDDGIAVVANSLTLNGGTIGATDDATAATLDHAALTTAGHKVDIVVTLVTNFGQPATSRNWTISANSYALLEFTTGEKSGGYQLDSVALDVKSPSDTLQVEVRLYGETGGPHFDPYTEEPLATLTGSVTTEGRQIFTMARAPGGNLIHSRPYSLVIVGSGTGTVELGQVLGDGEDDGGADGWVIEKTADFYDGVDDPLDYDYPKLEFRGHAGAIPYLLDAAITSIPLNGETYHAGEHIEVTLKLSVPVASNGDDGQIPLWFGDGTEHYRSASPVTTRSFEADHWRTVGVYRVLEGDMDTDGVTLGEELLWDQGTPRWMNAADTDVPISTSFDFATVGTQPQHPVDGSQTWDCEQVFCAYPEFVPGTSDRFGYFFDGGRISSTYFRYQDEEYIVSGIVQLPAPASLLALESDSVVSDKVVARLALVFAGTVLPLRDANKESVSSHSWITDTYTKFDWSGREVRWTQGEKPLLQFIENVDVSFASDTYTVAEDGTVEVALTLSADLGRDVKVPITVVNQDGATDQDYTTVPTEVSFVAGETAKSFVITPVDDEVDDDDETLKVLFGTLPENLSPGTTTETVVTIVDNDDPQVEVNFRRAIHDVAEGADRTVTVRLTADPERTVVVPLMATDRDGASSADYSVPDSVTFESGETTKDVTFTATDDAIDDDGERVLLEFGTLPDGVTPGTVPTSTVSIIDDDDPQVNVSYGLAGYTAAEGGSVTVTVELDADPERTVVIPVSHTARAGATSADYSGVPESVTFDAGDTEKTFTFSADDDTVDDDDEEVLLGFGTLPTGVSAGTVKETLVSITDDDDPEVKVSFGADQYTASEGGTVEVTVILDDDPERTVTIPMTATGQDGATSSDYSGVPANVTFGSGDTSKSFTFTATHDTVDDDDEEVLITFGTLPTGVSAGTVKETLVSITDDDDPEVKVSFGAGQYTVAEGGAVEVTVTLDEDPERTVVIPLARENLGGTSDSDYSGVPESVTFGSGDTSRTFTVAAVDDKLRDSGEELKLTFGTLPSGMSEGSLKEARVTITDSQFQGELTVGFGLGAITVAEGGTAQVTVSLSEAPGSDVTIPLTATAQDGATSSDYSGVPESVTFESSDTEQTFTFTAVDDTVDDDGESVLLAFGTLPSGVLARTVKETLVSITDDDLPASLTVNFGADRYTVAEGGTVEVTVTLDEDPEQTVVIPVTAAGQDGATSSDYSGVPESVTFGSGDTSKSFTFTATHDTVDDDDEEVLITFGTLPTGVSAGTVKETLVSITDDDDPEVKVSFGADQYTVAEGGTISVVVELDADPERSVTIPITATNEGGATSADYSVPDSVTFTAGETSKAVVFTATMDAVDDDGETVLLGFGSSLPDQVATEPPATATVTIDDDDDPQVEVNFRRAIHDVAEGADRTVTVKLTADPERTVIITISATDQDGATDADYSVPDTVTFGAGETTKDITFTATQDAIDDDGESVLLEFGTLPDGVTAGTVPTSTVSIIDDDAPASVAVSWAQDTYSVAEGGSVTVTVELDDDPERQVTVPITATNQDGASNADYSRVPNSVTFNSGETSKDITFTATQDALDDDDESVQLAFGTLPSDVSPGTVKETVVRIDDDDDPEVKVSFAQSSYTAPEGATVSVVVELDADPERSVTIPITATNEGGATAADYSVPDSVTFAAGETAKAVVFTATMDDQDDDDESVQLAFGPTLPPGVTQGTPSTTTVSITDDDLAGDRLMSLVVAPRDIDGFDPEVTGYMVGVASTVTQATITANPAYEDATVAIDGTTVTAGSAHAVDLSAGLNTFEVVVTSADNDQATYTVYIGRGTTGQGGWKAGDDLDTLRAAGNTEPNGIWSNGTTIWIADVSNARLYAYSQAGGARDADKDIAVNGTIIAPTGIWSDSATIWVIGPVEMTVFAHTLGSGARDSDSDISLGSDLMLPVDMWSDGDTMWVLDSHGGKLYAYSLADNTRDSDKDIDLAGENAAPLGVWSNGTTIWVTDRDDRKIYAYNFSGERVTGHDIDLHSRNADAGAIWGNDDTLWVANDINDVSSPFNRVFTYNNVPVTVTFGQSSYTVAESDDTSTTEVAENAVQVKVTLSADPKRQVVVPITATRQGTVTGADYSGVPANLTFESGDTEKSFTFTATHDTVDDDDESVHLTFGMLPQGVTGGTNSEAVVSIIDDDIGVSFERMGYETTEGDSVDVKVTLSSPATREVTIPLDADKQGGASDDDYSGVQDSITFQSSDTETSIKFTAIDDEVDDDGEKVRLRFGTLPTGLVPGPNVEATITITDNDMPTDRLMSLVVAPKDIDGFDPEVTGYMVGVASTVTQATITATPHRPDDTVTIDGTTVTGGSAHTVDLSVGLNTLAVVVDSAITQEQSAYTVYIGRGTTGQGGWKAGDDLDTLRSPGNTSPTGAWSNGLTMWIADSNDGKLYAYTLAGGSRDSDKDITLDSNNSNPVGIWSDDTTIWVAELMPTERKVYAYTLADGSRDSDKDITLRGDNTTAWGVWSDGTTMWVVDWNDDDLYAYTLADDTRDPDKDIALSGDNTSPRGMWSDGTTIWVVDSSGAKLYAYALSDGVRVEGYDIGLHSSNAAAGGIWANDDTTWVVNSATEDGSPFDRVFTYNNIPVEVSFQSATYTVAENGSVTVKVTLSADPKRTVVIPLTATNQGGASSADYSGVPNSVTFESGETSKDITFSATDDSQDDDDESVRLAFGTLPSGVSAGTVHETVVSITDDDLPATVTVRFDQSTYTATEGGDDAVVTVLLGSPAKSQVEIALTANGHGGATEDDWSGVPETVTFDIGDNSKSFTVTAIDDNVEDNGEMVELGFGTLPAGFAPGSPSTARITLMNEDGMGVGETPGQNRVCTKGEITIRGQTDRWIWRITDSSYLDEYTIDLMGLHSNKGTLRDPHIVYKTKIYTHDGFYPPAGFAYGGFPSYASNDGGVGWDSSSRIRFRNRTGSYSYFPGKEPELDTGYYTVLVGANPFGDGANGLGSYTLCIEGSGSISAVDQPERRVVVSAAHVDVSDGEPAQFSIKLGARPTGPVEVFMTKLEPASDSQYVVEPLMHSFTVDNWDIPQVATVRRKADYAPPLNDGFAIHYWGKGGGYHKAFEFLDLVRPGSPVDDAAFNC